MKSFKQFSVLILFGFLTPLSAFSSDSMSLRNLCDQIQPESDSSTELTPLQRASLFCRFNESLKQKYSLWDLKRERLGLDIDLHMNGCAATELDIQSEKYGNIFLADRFLKCMSAFQDSHLTLFNQSPLPIIYLGLHFIETENGLVVASVNRKLLSQSMSPDLVAKIIPGLKVLSIDGESPLTKIAEMAQYISGSSNDYVRQQSVAALSKRSFAYPQSSVTALEFEGFAQPVQTKWWAAELNYRSDSRSFMKEIGIPSVASFDLKMLNSIRKNQDGEGYYETTAVFAEPLTEFISDRGLVDLRVGKVKTEESFACYFQLMTFDTHKWHLSGSSFPFEFPFVQMLKQCQANSWPAILDIRVNNGGNPDLPPRLLSLFTEPSKEYPSTFFSGRITKHLIDIINKLSGVEGFPKQDAKKFPLVKRLQALEWAIENGKNHLPAIPNPNIKASPEVSGFTQPVVALIGEQCISSCDVMAALLKQSGRATLVGSHSNATGGSYFEFGSEPRTPKAEWRDDVFGTFTIKIMNALIGVAPVLSPPEEYKLPIEEYKNYIRENQPVSADAPYFYRTRQEDVTGNNRGWQKIIAKALRSPSARLP